MAYLSGHNSGHSTVIEGKKSQNRGISETGREIISNAKSFSWTSALFPTGKMRENLYEIRNETQKGYW